ncbi:hypothetical protein LINGRAHAP2_LOCUS27575 [Linum grandiflorum]
MWRLLSILMVLFSNPRDAQLVDGYSETQRLYVRRPLLPISALTPSLLQSCELLCKCFILLGI